MKHLLVLIALAFTSATFAGVEPAKKEETNCVTKDKKGNCPPPPKSAKPTPKKKIEHKEAEAKK
jgi:hypothetical protein